MSIIDVTLAYLTALAWPITVLVVVLLLRPVQVAPGPCPGRLDINHREFDRCQLRAGHAGLHQCEDAIWGDP